MSAGDLNSEWAGGDPSPVSDQTGPESTDGAMTIRLEGYEGPLDLLLHLIKRDEIDIWNIPIARVTEQYLKYLQLMRDLNISVAGEWLVMAATLIHIKSHMLLPPDPSAPGIEEAAEDPRTELVYQLLEHLKYKNAAQMLYTRQEVENAVWNRPPSEVIEEGKDLLAVSLFDLLRAFNEVVERFSQRSRIEMFGEEVTVAQKIEEIRRLLLIQDALKFSALFQDAPSKQHLIATFLALLELVRLKEIGVRQRKTFGEIWISRSLSPA